VTRGALVVDGETVPDAQVRRRCDALVSELRAAGAGPGRGVTLLDGHPLALVTAVRSARSLGAPLLAGNPGWRAPDAGRAVVAALHGDGSGGLTVRPLPAGSRPPFPDGTGAVFWTSGSTGEPKAVALGAAALEYQSDVTRGRLGLAAGDRMLVPLPLGHAYGFSVLQMHLRHGMDLHVLTRAGVGPVVTALKSAAGPFASLDGVPSLYAALSLVARRDVDLARALGVLRVRGCGGDVLPRPLAEQFLELAGPLHDGYGLTEAGPNVALSGPDDWRLGTVGPPLRGTKVRIDPAGEVLVRGPGLMTGYLDGPEGDDYPTAADGWLRTGDLGRLADDGHLTVTGRLKAAIVVHGVTYPPALVENALLGCTGVTEAVAVAVASGRPRGDEVAAFVRTEHEISEADLLAVGRETLPVALWPRSVRIVHTLPRTRSGKVDRSALRALVTG